MPALKITVTTAGLAALANAQKNGTVPVTLASIGVTATSFARDAGMLALPDEIKRVTTLAGGATAADTLHVTMRDDSTDTYTLRGIGLYLADGTLFAVYGQADVLLQKSAQATALLAVDVQFADINAASLTFGDTNFQLNAATIDAAGVVQLADDATTTTGTETGKAVTPKGLLAALNARFGAGAPSAFVKGLLTATTALAFRTTLAIKGAALYDTGAGNGLDADLLDGQQGAYYRDYNHLQNVPISFPPSAHQHSAADITSGTLLVARGGTGAGTLTAGSYLIGNGTNAVTFKSPSQVLTDINAAPLVHSHDIGDVNGLQAALDAKLPATATAVAAAKLSAARSFALTGIVTAAAVNFDGSGNVSLATAIADSALSIAKTSGLQAALDAKQPAGSYVIGGNGITLADGALLSDASGIGVYSKGNVPIPTDSPVSSAVKMLNIGPNGWNTQIAFEAYTTGMYVRARTASSAAFGQWYKIWTAANFDPTTKLDATATASAATKLSTPRAFMLTGTVTAEAVNFDGSGNVSLTTVIADGALSIAKTSGLQAAITAAQSAAQTSANAYTDNRFVVPATSGVLDWNDASNIKPGAGASLMRGLDSVNGPSQTDSSLYYYPFNVRYGSSGIQVFQWALPYGSTQPANSGPFFRTSYAGNFTAWSKVWCSHNDGIGSGLDADLLQGVDGANYTRADLTSLGKTGSVSADGTTNTPALWSALPVGYARLMLGATIGTAGGAPAAEAGYFIKTGNRDVSGGWGGIWLQASAANSSFVGFTPDNATAPIWSKLWTDRNFNPASKLDATATAAAATKLATPRAFTLTGIVTAAAVNFDGSGNVSLATVIADGALSIAKTSGLQAALDAKAPTASPTFTGTATVAALASSGAITGASIRSTGTIMAAGGFQIG